MTVIERDRLAAAIIALRPDWASNGIDRLGPANAGSTDRHTAETASLPGTPRCTSSGMKGCAQPKPEGAAVCTRVSPKCSRGHSS